MTQAAKLAALPGTLTIENNRITGDFSNSTVANRVMFQTSTVNGSTAIEAIPNGTATTASFMAVNAADPTNASVLNCSATATDTRINSGYHGTGTYLPMTFYTGGSERMRIATDGQFLVGASSIGSRKNYFAGSLMSSSDSRMLEVNGTLHSTNTSAARGIFSTITTPDTGTTFSMVQQFACAGITKGATDTVTNLYGFIAESGLTQGVNNYGFYSNLAAATGRWNLYVNGTASNYFAGKVFSGSSTGGGSIANYTYTGWMAFGKTTTIDVQGSQTSTPGYSTLYLRYQGASAGNYGHGITCHPYEDSGTEIRFLNSVGTQVGGIAQNGSATSYNTTSDYRLKGNVEDLVGSGEFIDRLRPRKWLWNSGPNIGTPGVGFIAHEIEEVSPSSVTGKKDAVDHQGNPLYQCVEYGSSEVIAMLVAEIQSLRARVAQLETK